MFKKLLKFFVLLLSASTYVFAEPVRNEPAEAASSTEIEQPQQENSNEEVTPAKNAQTYEYELEQYTSSDSSN